MDNTEKSLLQNLRVLYVEDEDDTRYELSKIIKRRVGKLFIAKNGLEGIESFTENQPDIIITDLKMPNMDGIEMIKRIRELGGNTPVIIISALSDSDTILNAIDIGIVKYIVKPVDTSELVETMEGLAENILKKDLKETLEKEMLYIEKESKQELEEKIKREIAKIIKLNSGRGPKNIDVFIKGNKIEINANETLTLFELSLISKNRNYSLVEYNRRLFYDENKKELEREISEIMSVNIKLEDVSVDARKKVDALIFSF